MWRGAGGEVYEVDTGYNFDIYFSHMHAVVMLEDGFYLEGKSFGAEGESFGEVVFNTSMTGYQEILTDPSYRGQIVTMTYPLIGNYGINNDDVESYKTHCSGFIVREKSRTFSSWRADGDLDGFLKKNDVIGVTDVDTRALTRHIRSKGAMRAMISTSSKDLTLLHKKVLDSPSIVGVDLVKEVSCTEGYSWEEGTKDLLFKGSNGHHQKNENLKVVAMDFGIKYNILRMLYSLGCSVRVVPADTKAEAILAMKPDGIFLSNGPGDPTAVDYAVETVQKLAGSKPIFGICLGHQIISLAFGGKTFKLKFGHRGANHPVKNLKTSSVEITSQNHGFAVDTDSFKNRSIDITHISLNDGTCEGLLHKNLPIFSVQYHPEASPGPHDSHYLFENFVALMKRAVKK